MISLDFQEVNALVEKMSSMSEKLRPPPVRFYPYLKRVLEADWDTVKPQYPMTVKIPKDAKYLIKGDFEPEYELVIEEPIRMDDGTPIWFNNTASEAFLRFGYENLDARKISRVLLNMEYIHCFLGGSSGHGKSVTLNSMIGALCYEYPPWELELHLSDAKIIEFKKYGVGNKIPHIATIAATEDADFVRSVLNKAKNEMIMRGKIFGNIGASNLKNFRKKTGLALPRVFIVMDEVESTFKMAGKLAGKLADDIDAFARLGRAAGYHILMATQNMSSDIPSSAIGQIRNRFCLGANQKTSEAVLGNLGATYNFGRIGRMICNTEVLNGGDTTPYNVSFQTPFIDDDEFLTEMEFLERKGRESGFRAYMSFYDENDMKTVAQFDETTSTALKRMSSGKESSPNRTPICLGTPAFVSEDKDNILKVWADGKDVENILVCSSVTERSFAHLHNISKCLADGGYAIQFFTTDLDQKEWIYKPLTVVESRNAEQAPLSTVGSLVRKRLFLLQMDRLAVNASYSREAVEAVFEKDGIPSESRGNELLCKRVVAFSNEISKKEWEDIRYLFPSFKEVYDEFKKCNCLVKQLDVSDFVKAAFFVGDLAKIVGYGRDFKSRPVGALKKVMQDASRVGVIFILYSRSMEGLNELLSGLRYVIFDMPDKKDWGRLRADEPTSLSSNLAVLYDIMDSEEPQKKFKRTLLKEEN